MPFDHNKLYALIKGKDFNLEYIEGEGPLRSVYNAKVHVTLIQMDDKGRVMASIYIPDITCSFTNGRKYKIVNGVSHRQASMAMINLLGKKLKALYGVALDDVYASRKTKNTIVARRMEDTLDYYYQRSF